MRELFVSTCRYSSTKGTGAFDITEVHAHAHAVFTRIVSDFLSLADV